MDKCYHHNIDVLSKLCLQDSWNLRLVFTSEDLGYYRPIADESFGIASM